MTAIQRIRVPAGFAYAGAFLFLARPQPFVACAGIALAAVGLGIRIWAAGYLRREGVLAVAGPYGWTRNPLYFGSFLLGLGFSLASGQSLLILAFLTFFLAIYRPVMKKEEEELIQRFGSQYGPYRQKVPFFWPGIEKKWRLPSGTSKRFEWKEVLWNREYRAVAGFVSLTVFVFMRLLFSITVLAAPTAELKSSRGACPEPFLEDGLPYRVPFQPGEKLVYEVNWQPLFLVPAFRAGELLLTIEESMYLHKDTFHISARAISNFSFLRLGGIKINNYFESTIDRNRFYSYRILKRIRQGKRKRDIEILFDYTLDQTRVRETDVALSPPKQIRDDIINGIPGPLNDILSVFYVARLRILKAGGRYLVYLSDNGKHREVQVNVGKPEKVETSIGPFQAIQVSTEGGVLGGGGDFRVWYSQDSLRVPVKFEAVARVGKIYGQLVQLETTQLSKGVIETDE